jgi:hypothetical protein
MDFDAVVWAPVYPGSKALRACFGPVTIDVFPADMLADGRWRWSMAATEDGVADAEFVIMHSAESLPDCATAQRAGVAALLAWRDSIRPAAPAVQDVAVATFIQRAVDHGKGAVAVASDFAVNAAAVRVGPDLDAGAAALTDVLGVRPSGFAQHGALIGLRAVSRAAFVAGALGLDVTAAARALTATFVSVLLRRPASEVA